MNKFLAVALAAASLGACAAPPEAPPLAGATMGGAFSLVDQRGERVTDASFPGQYKLVYFGFSFCPDVCPVDLQVIGQGLRALEKSKPAEAGRVTPIFITVDPARDTPEELRKFAANFHPRLVALTGTEAEIAAVAKRYGVAFARQPAGPDGSYSVDHSRIAVLYDPAGAPLAIIPHDEGPAALADALAKWVA